MESSLNTLIAITRNGSNSYLGPKSCRAGYQLHPIFDASIQPDREQEIKVFVSWVSANTIDADYFSAWYIEKWGKPAGERRLLPGSGNPRCHGIGRAYRILRMRGRPSIRTTPEYDSIKTAHFRLDPCGVAPQPLLELDKDLKPLTLEKPQGYPSFMLGKAWARKSLNTFLGS